MAPPRTNSSVPQTPSPDALLIPPPHFVRSSSSEGRSRERDLDAFVECLVSAGPPEAFFDDCWDEHVSGIGWDAHVSRLVVEEEDPTDKAEEPDVGGPDEKVTENLADPSGLK